MRWRDFKIRKKMMLGFGVIVALLVFVVLKSYTGVGDIVDNSSKVIYGNRLDGLMVRMELTHLNWANKINAILTDDSNDNVEINTGGRECDIGKWLSGSERKEAESRFPSLVPLFSNLEKIHDELHKSARVVLDTHRRVDVTLPGFLTQREVNLLKWENNIKTAFFELSREISIETDEKDTVFGSWLFSGKSEKAAKGHERLLHTFEDMRSAIHSLFAGCKELVDVWNPKAPKAAYSTYRKKISPAMDRMKVLLNTARTDAENQLIAATEANEIYAQQTLPLLLDSQKILGRIRDEIKKNAVTDEIILDKAHSTQGIVAFIGAVSIFFGILISLYLSGNISRPVLEAMKFAKAMSEGDFTRNLSINQKDEIGSLASALNHMTSNLGSMFKRITKGVETLSSSSLQLSTISGQMSAGGEQTSGKANTVAAAAGQMSANISSLAESMENAATNVRFVVDATKEMISTVDEIGQKSEKAHSITAEAVSEAQRASAEIISLGKAAKEIDKVSAAITEISEQTNLLALNATIEAARAGEAGKGFAVVANEIKELAKQTAEATQDIKDMVEGIQNSTGESVTRVESITKVIDAVNEIVNTIASAVEEQTATTGEIAKNMAQMADGIQEINENVAQSSIVAGEIAQDIFEVNHSSSEMSCRSSEVNLNAEELKSLANELMEIAGKFKV